MRNLLTGAQLLAARAPGRTGPAAGFRVAVDGAAATDPATLPDYVQFALAQWRLLHDIPFVYLVPDAELLPGESLRFFDLDGDWLDALAAGALQVGAVTAVDQARVSPAETPKLTASADRYRPMVRDVRRGRATLGADPPAAEASAPDQVVTGFLLRSALAANWPGLSVRAFTTVDVPSGADPAQWEHDHPETVVPLLRLERLAPSVLLALFDGVPALVWFEEPHHGVQLGAQAAGDGYRVPLRGPTGDPLGVPDVPVPMRAGSIPGVVDVDALAAALDHAAPLAAPRGSAGLALCLLQPPARQRFAATSS
jgi:hypothetical protein